MLKQTRFFIVFSISLFSLLACKPGVPNGILSESKMEEILYDYHLAKGMANQKSGDSVSYYTRYFHQKVFEKYDIDEAYFDSSMIWYSRHTERLSNIYKRLAERMGYSSGVTFKSNFLASGESTANGDTLNMWPLGNSLMVHSKAANYTTFRAKADSLINPGDLIVWKFASGWYYSEGYKQGVAILAARLYNDSTIYTTRQLFESSTTTELSLHLGNDSIKEVEGFIYQITPTWTARPRFITLSDIQLLRIKRNKQNIPTVPSSVPTDRPLMQKTDSRH